MNKKHYPHLTRSEFLLVAMYIGFLSIILFKIFPKGAPLIWDASTHYIDSVRYYISIVHMNWKSMPYIDRYWPPLGSLIPVPAYVLFGPTPRLGILVENAVSVASIVLALHKLSNYFGKKASIVATFVTLTSPIILDQSTTFMIDLPLTAMVVIEWYLLLRSRGFTNRRYTILSALFFGLGLLAKWTFVFFVIVPFLYELATALHVERHNNEIKIRPSADVIKNILVFAGVALLVAGWWYIPNIKPVINSVIKNSRISGAIEGDPPIFSIKSALYYFFTAIDFYLNPIILGLFLASLALLLSKIRETSVYIKLVVWQLMFVYTLFTLTRNKDPRFLMPTIPFLGVIIGQTMNDLKNANKNRILYTAFVIILLIGGVLNVATFTKTIPPTKIGNDSQIIAIASGNLYLSGYYWSFSINTTEKEWKIPEILSVLKMDNKSYITVYVLSNNPFLTYPLRYRTITWKKTVVVTRPNTYRLIPGLFSADYILYTQSEKHSAYWEVKYSNLARKLFIEYNNITKAFIPIKKFEFPDGTKGILYKRRPSVPIIHNATADNIKITCQDSNSTFGNEVRLKAICIYKIDGIHFIGYLWTPLKKMKNNYTIFVHITNKKGDTVYQLDHKPCSGICPTSTWVPNDDVIEMYYLKFPLTGCYQIRLGLWNPVKRERLPVSGNNDGHNRAITGRICKIQSVAILPVSH